ncbi:hypothetical protein K503DRAFT_746487 [Rhizopogon vinicolor AM-OR11-026]|uniref:Yeast cell wall synthesis Kre9/Knh1-like N-terminal domain-containing protein n=1 Tax=Rhizopogon vinicolor AM-OR11-026 TaxID=1314800 RepID=A0A1B7MR41_9AGAM|nr:hypothetical protein K503DRAFT_746487 [Rhizopogon vinicolor AM-OR11-026]
MFSKAIISLVLAASALANIFTTAPVASTTFTGGQQATITWQDDGLTPSLTSFGPALVGIYVGNANQQTLLQTITASVDVSTTSSIVFTPDATIGPDGSDYFIRFQSLSLKDATNAQYPAEAFSAKFTLTNMTGTFNSTVQAEINGQSTAPIGATASSSATGATSTKLTSATTSHASSASSSAKATSTSSTGAAGKVGVAGVACFIGTAASLLGAALF